jgi:acetylornithine deacetylase/succinyl-diaminopimelate desuccinylase-like protein
MARLTLSDDDKEVRDWFKSEMKTLGCQVKVDQMGNMFAVRPGKKGGAPTAMGSHLDTQPTGGRYDGILGIMAAVEAMRTIHGEGYATEYPLAVVNWTK